MLWCIYIKHKIILVVENNVNDDRNYFFKICLKAVFFYILTNNVDVIYVDAFNEFISFTSFMFSILNQIKN